MFKQKLLAIIFGIALLAFSVYAVLDTFVITRVYAEVPAAQAESETQSESSVSFSTEAETLPETETAAPSESETETSSETQTADSVFQSEPVITDTSYSDENISVNISEYYENGTAIYVADVQVSSAEYLKTAFAYNSYGKNVTASTSEIAEDNNAIFAVNGDFYGSQETGYVLRNGILYRSSADSGQEDLVIYKDGSFEVINESEVSAESLEEAGAEQILSFGPALVSDGEIAISEGEEVGKAMASNPRTAIGIIDDLHYVFVVSDGRTDESSGLSLHELAAFMQKLGVETAYNLDGGGSSTMYFNGNIVNNPASGHKRSSGSSSSERSVSDIVYIGY